MSRFDWDRVRRDKLVSGRGGDPLDLPAGPRRKPATVAQQQATIARLRAQFRVRSYTDQLEYLTIVRRQLAAVLGDDDRAAKMIATEFKPLLKRPAAAAAPAPAGTEARRRKALQPKALRSAVVQLVRRHASELNAAEVVAVLRGESERYREDPAHGTASTNTATEVERQLEALRSLRAITSKKGKLRPSGSSGPGGSNKKSPIKPQSEPTPRSRQAGPGGYEYRRYDKPWAFECANCKALELRDVAFALIARKPDRRRLCRPCYQAGKRLA